MRVCCEIQQLLLKIQNFSQGHHKLNKISNKNIFLTLQNNEKLYFGEVRKTLMGELTIGKFSQGYEKSYRTPIINHIIQKNNFNSYLEIGTHNGSNFDKIIIKEKIGVDPKPLKEDPKIIRISSDNFFKTNNSKYDIIFIDGLHLEDQADRDLKNSINYINDNGIIIMHDCNPPSEFHQRQNYKINEKFPPWNGTAWRSYVKLRMKNKNLSMCCVDCDWGVGIIKKGKQKLYNFIEDFSYWDLHNDRKTILNLISVKQFLEMY